MSEFHKDLTSGSVTKQLIRFSLPFLISNFIQALYNIADMLVVQWVVGANGSAAVGIGGQLTFLVTNVVIGFAVGGTILISQYIGAKKHKDVQETISTLFTLFIFAAIILSVVMIALARPLLRLLNTPPESFEYAYQYMTICMAGNIFIFGYNAVSAILRGMGDSKRPLIFVAIACVLNIILDIVFVKFLGMAVSGSALATIIAQAFSLAVAVIYLYRHDFIFDFKFKSFRIFKDKLSKIIQVGLPTAIQNSIVTLSFLTLTSLINEFGESASAAAQLSGKFNSIAILPGVAMSAAISSMAGQNIGAGKPDRAKKCVRSGLMVAVSIGAVAFAATLLFAPQIMQLLSDGDEKVIEFGVTYMRAFCVDYIFASIMFCYVGLINGSGHTKITLVLNIMSAIGVRVPMAYLMVRVFDMGLVGIGFCAPVASLTTATIAIIYVQSGKWKTPPKGMGSIRLEEESVQAE